MPRIAAIAVAGPVTHGSARFTNRVWQISETELKSFGFEQALLINDFAALAFAVEILEPKDLRTVGPELAPSGAAEPASITILGPGTGFGVSCLARYGERFVPMATEGGHVAFAPGDEQEAAVLQALRKQYGRVSVERILSGPGLESLYRTLEQIGGRETAALTAAEIVAHAGGNDPGCRAALTMFCSIFGSVAGDFALAHGARGGVYIGGGIAQRIEAFLIASPFPRAIREQGPVVLLRGGHTDPPDRASRGRLPRRGARRGSAAVAARRLISGLRAARRAPRGASPAVASRARTTHRPLPAVRAA